MGNQSSKSKSLKNTKQPSKSNPLCFCTAALQQSLTESDHRFSEWKCRNCFNLYDKNTLIYHCGRYNKCQYHQITGANYMICAHCFQDMKLREKHITKELNVQQLFTQKIKSFLQFTENNISNRTTGKKKKKKREATNASNKEYACNLYEFYSLFLSNLKDFLSAQEEKESQDEYSMFVAEFNRIYSELLLNNISVSIDKDHLEFTDYIFEHSENMNDKILTDKCQDLIQQIKVKWLAINNSDAVFDDEFCDDLRICGHVQRINFVLDIYEKYELQSHKNNSDFGYDFMLLFNHCFMQNDYGLIQLIDDFNHFIATHRNIEHLTQMNEGNIIKFCNNKDCKSLDRRFNRNQSNRDIKEDESKQEVPDFNAYEHSIINQIDRMHTFFSHSQGIVIDENTENKMRDLINPRFLAENNDKFITQIEQNEEEKSQATTPKFGFGERFYYWDYMKQSDNFIESPNHSNLKQELLKNKIYNINISDWNNTVNKALRYKQCKRGKQLKAKNRGATNQYYKIAVGLAITTAYLVCLLFYTNFTELQYRFKKFGTRKTSKSDTLEQLKKRNQEIGNWYKLFYEIILFFGDETTTSKHLFFHGLSIKLVFSSFYPRFNAPISTTTNIMVAQRFADSGIILQLQPDGFRFDMFFSVEWCSDYPGESEALFGFAGNMMITDIRQCGSNHSNVLRNHGFFLRAFILFDSIFNGVFFVFNMKKKTKSTQKMLIKFIQKYMQTDKDETGIALIDEYFVDMFEYLVQRKKDRKNYVIKSEYLLLTQALQNELIVFDESSDDVLDNNKMRLSPFLSSFMDRNCLQVMEEYIWFIGDDKYSDLMRLKQGQYLGPGGTPYSYIFPNEHFISFDLGICRSSHSWPEHSGIKLKINSFSSGLSSVKLWFNMAVDEVKYCLNDCRAVLKEGGFLGIHTFPNKYFNKNMTSLTIRVDLRFEING